MDEPTANLGASAIEKVRKTILKLKENGIAVIIISHRIEDILAVGDRLMVLRQGRLVGSQAVAETDTEKIVHMIVTGEVQD
jgi:ABC-type sugar transport system ATPase subunit